MFWFQQGQLKRYFFVQVEVYNIVFAAQNQVYCFRCATKSGPELKGFHVLEEYDFDVLTNIYESFVVDQTTSVSIKFDKFNKDFFN